MDDATNRSRGGAHDGVEDPVVAAIESNLADYWLAMGRNPKGEIHDGDSIRWEYSGGPYFNRVVSSELDGSVAEQEIDQIVREFANRRAAITWLVGPSSKPSDLGKRLTQHGFNEYEIWKGMARELGDLCDPPASVDLIEWCPVRDDASRRDWLTVIAKSYQLPTDAQAILSESVISAEAAAPDDWHHNLAYLDGKPVAASSLFVSGTTAGIYLVATVPEARGQGLGTAVTWKAMSQARNRGCTLVVLQSTAEACGVYERLGFRAYCDISVYRLPPPGTMWRKMARVGARWLRRRQSRNARQSSWGTQKQTDLSGNCEPGKPLAM